MARQETLQNSRVSDNERAVLTGTKFIGATFLYFALALLVTFAVVAGLGFLLSANGDAITSEANLSTFLAIYIGAIIAYIPILIWVHIAARRNGRSVGVGFFVYSIVLGVIIAPAVLLVPIEAVLIAFGSTVLAFAIMALIAWTSKKDLSGLAVVGFGLIIGAFILSITNLIFYLIVGFEPLYWLVSFLFFIAIILFTLFDLKQVQQIALNGGAERSVAFICALNLYVDFIYIFIRLLRIVVMIMGNRR
ncbi:MAG: Bax inhibitor-1 family protein [Bacilli bacterium]|nr:Bax inhibitor-1 family protein [Bacilli bacterium]